MFIDGFGISSYRSFGKELQLIGPCNKINFFIGQNNSGKSNILRFLNDHFNDALVSARGSRKTIGFSDLDRHFGENSAKIQIAFGLKKNGPLYEQILEKRKVESSHVLTLVERFLQLPELASVNGGEIVDNQSSNIAWFFYEANWNQALAIALSEYVGIAKDRIVRQRYRTNESKVDLSNLQIEYDALNINYNRVENEKNEAIKKLAECKEECQSNVIEKFVEWFREVLTKILGDRS